MAEEIREAFIGVMTEPTRENYLALVDRIASEPSYDPYGNGLGRLGQLMQQGKFREMVEGARQHLPNLLLSPRLHQLLSFAYHKLGEEEAAGMEFSLGARCIEAIKSTGDGSEGSPYIVLRVEDEYDVLESEKKEMRMQSARVKDGRSFDCLGCTDGTEVWFDITIPKGWLDRRMRGRGG